MADRVAAPAAAYGLHVQSCGESCGRHVQGDLCKGGYSKVAVMDAFLLIARVALCEHTEDR